MGLQEGRKGKGGGARSCPRGSTSRAANGCSRWGKPSEKRWRIMCDCAESLRRSLHCDTVGFATSDGGHRALGNAAIGVVSRPLTLATALVDQAGTVRDLLTLLAYTTKDDRPQTLNRRSRAKNKRSVKEAEVTRRFGPLHPDVGSWLIRGQ